MRCPLWPRSDQLPRCRETTLWATSGQSAAQQRTNYSNRSNPRFLEATGEAPCDSLLNSVRCRRRDRGSAQIVFARSNFAVWRRYPKPRPFLVAAFCARGFLPLRPNLGICPPSPCIAQPHHDCRQFSRSIPSSIKPREVRPSQPDAPNPPHGVSCREGARDCVRPLSPSL